MSLHPLVVVFLVIWCGVAVAFGITQVARAVREGGAGTSLLWSPGMVLFAWTLTTVAFGFEEHEARERLNALFRGPAAEGRVSPQRAPA